MLTELPVPGPIWSLAIDPVTGFVVAAGDAGNPMVAVFGPDGNMAPIPLIPFTPGQKYVALFREP
jgi:hypothetical protein